LKERHEKAVEKTKSHTVECMPDYRRRVMKVVGYVEKEYPEIYDEAVYKLSSEQKSNPRYHYHRATHDFHYDQFPTEILQSFMSDQWRDKEKGIKYTYDHLRKYHDAILKCAEFSPSDLPPSYRNEMTPYLDNLKKELVKAKSNGKVSEQDADPICFGLYEQLCKWAVMRGLIFVWVFLVLQWSLMARACNVDSISFQNFWADGDCVKFKYDLNKRDRKGEKTTEKHCYANPLKPAICLFLAFGCYLCIFQQKFDRDCNKVFRAMSEKEKSASSSYSKALKKMIDGIKGAAQKLREYSIRDGHFNPHGMRKGSGISVTTGSMEPPPIPSVLLRGEWSMGKVLEVYWRFSAIGDTYLGRCLAGLRPDEPNFGVLPPHFTVGRENPFVDKGMKLCFGVILERYGASGCEGALLLFLASIVHHRAWLRTHIGKSANHPFSQIPILNNEKLLGELAKLVTLEKGGAVTSATGVPPNVKIREEVREAIGLLHQYRRDVQWLQENLSAMVKNAMEEKATENGNITATFVAEQVAAATAKATEPLVQKMEEMEGRLTAQIGASSTHRTAGNSINTSASLSESRLDARLYPTYKYHDPDATERNKHKSDWDVPQGFKLPTADLYSGWTRWLQGMTSNATEDGNGKIINAPVKPLRLLKHGNLPYKIRRSYDNNWKPIMELMEDEVKEEVRNRHVDDMDFDFFRSTYAKALEGATEKYPEFANAKTTWKVSTYVRKKKEADRRRKLDAMVVQ